MAIPSAFTQTIVPLWYGSIPQSCGTAPHDIPTLSIFLPTKPSLEAPAIVICPGGAYAGLAFDHEGVNEASGFRSEALLRSC